MAKIRVRATTVIIAVSQPRLSLSTTALESRTPSFRSFAACHHSQKPLLPILHPAPASFLFTPPPAPLLPHVRRFHISATMSSDADYAAFLDKANQDTGASNATTQSSKKFGTKAVDTAVPNALESVEAYYVSDADEPFEAVALKFAGQTLDPNSLKKLILHEGADGDVDVEEIQEKEFDPRGQYKNVLQSVKEVGNGVKVFRVGLGGTRVEYWAVGLSKEGGKVVGLKALAVES